MLNIFHSKQYLAILVILHLLDALVQYSFHPQVHLQAQGLAPISNLLPINLVKTNGLMSQEIVQGDS